jgi:alanine dehydrogenase
MIVGVPKEVKSDEYRVAMVPIGVEELTKAGHTVLVQTGAGIGSSIADDQYASCGAEIVPDAAAVWSRADMIVKVKEPMPSEWPMMRSGQLVFTYFHFAADEHLTHACLKAGITAVAYETITDARGGLPLLTPMSEVAGRMSIQEGAKYLERPQEGRGSRRRPGHGAGTRRRRCRGQCRENRGRPRGQRLHSRYQSRPPALPR